MKLSTALSLSAERDVGSHPTSHKQRSRTNSWGICLSSPLRRAALRRKCGYIAAHSLSRVFPVACINCRRESLGQRVVCRWKACYRTGPNQWLLVACAVGCYSTQPEHIEVESLAASSPLPKAWRSARSSIASRRNCPIIPAHGITLLLMSDPDSSADVERAFLPVSVSYLHNLAIRLSVTGGFW